MPFLNLEGGGQPEDAAMRHHEVVFAWCRALCKKRLHTALDAGVNPKVAFAAQVLRCLRVVGKKGRRLGGAAIAAAPGFVQRQAGQAKLLACHLHLGSAFV